MLVVSNLSCQRNERFLFKSLNFCVPLHHSLLLVGPNGCGKTSLLRLLAGCSLPDFGEISWAGIAIYKAPTFSSVMAYLGHLDGLKGPLSVADNLLFARVLANKPAPSTSKMLSWLDAVGLTESNLLTKPCQKLSAGQKRRVSLACVLAKEACLWLLDEPTAALDEAAQTCFSFCVQQHLAHGGCVVMSSHQLLSANQTLVLGEQ